MGGHALKTVKTVRKSAEEYYKIKEQIKSIFNGKLEIEFIPEVPGKADFGDLDILYQPTGFVSQLFKLIKECFQPHEIVSNGDVISFDYDNFQIDLIRCSAYELIGSNTMEMSKFFFSYGDFGGIMGQIVNRHKLKLGQDGLWLYVYLDENGIEMENSYGKVILTSKPYEICEYLGMDYQRWFTLQSKEEIFEYIKSCRLFRSDFSRDTNHKYRERSKKRPMYREFIEYIHRSTDANSNRSATIQNLQMEALEHFNKLEEFREIFARARKAKELSEKFNGRLFLDLGVPGKEIGSSLKKFKNQYENFENWLDKTEKDVIVEVVKIFVANFQRDILLNCENPL